MPGFMDGVTWSALKMVINCRADKKAAMILVENFVGLILMPQLKQDKKELATDETDETADFGTKIRA